MGKIYHLINADSIESFRHSLHKEYAVCKRKEYFVKARKSNSKFIFANRFEQYDAYNYLMANYGTALLNVDDVGSDLPELTRLGVCTGSDDRYLICGLGNEIWEVKDSYFDKSYEFVEETDGTSWSSCLCKVDNPMQYYYFVIPRAVKCEYLTSQGASLRNYGEDIEYSFALVIPYVDGSLDYGNASLVYLPVFCDLFSITEPDAEIEAVAINED